MLVSLSSQITRAFSGVISTMFLLCIATIRCAPVSSTSTPNLVPCESTEAATNSRIIRQNAEAFAVACRNAFDDFDRRSGPLSLGDLEDYNLPNIAVFSGEMSGDDRVATHYFVLQGFRRPMEAVNSDEGQYTGSQRFGTQLQNLAQLLQTVTQGVQELVCSNGASGRSQIGAMEDLPLPSLDSQISRDIRDYTVLYYMKQYASELHSDILIRIPVL